MDWDTCHYFMQNYENVVQWIEIPVIILCKTLKMFLLNLVIIGVKFLDSIFQ